LPGQNGRWDFSVSVPLTRGAGQTLAFEAWDRAGNRETYSVRLALDTPFDIQVLAPTVGSELISTEDTIPVEVVARVVGLPEDQYLTASVDALPGVVLSRAETAFVGELVLPGASSPHTLTVVARRADGTSLGQKVVNFSVKAAKDIPLEISFDEPLNGSQNVEANQPVVMSFNRPVTLSELTISVLETVHGKQYKPLPPGAGYAEFTNIELIDLIRSNQPVPGGPSLLPGGQSIIFYPTRDYGYGGTVHVTVKHGTAELGRARFDVRQLPTLLSGFIVDDEFNQVEGVTVSLPDLGLTTVTNREGAFDFGFGGFSAALPPGRHRLVVNPSLSSASYGNRIQWAYTQAGRHIELGALTVPLLGRDEPFRLLSSGAAAIPLLAGAVTLDLAQAELLFADGRREGNVHAGFVFGPGTGFQMPPFLVPVLSLTIQPMGIQVSGNVGLDLVLPPHPEGVDWTAALPERVVLAGIDNDALELRPVGVALIDKATGRLRSEGHLALTRLDYVCIAPLGAEGHQALMRRYGAGEISLSELTTGLGATP
jgi:hypothetical protein